MNKRHYKYLFGPVPSRRLGRSLGVDLTPFKASLSAWDPFSFEHINRPHEDIEFKRLIEGQWLLRNEFEGELWMEVFLVWGVNTTTKDVSSIAEIVKAIGPDKVQLNTAVRPPCEEFAYAVPEPQLGVLGKLFDPPAEVVAEYSSDASAKVRANEEDILEMLERRPCTLDQICRAFGLHRNEASKYLGKLVRTGSAMERRKKGEVYYSSVHDKEAVHAHN